MNIEVRYATTKDAALIADISRETFYETFADQNTEEDMDIFLNTQFTRGRLMLEVGTPGKTFLLAEEGDKIAGYAKLNENRHPEKVGSNNALELARLYVVKSMIGKGVGAVLMKTIIDIAAKKGKDTLWLGVWKENKRAIGFYKKWGFKVFDQCDFILGNDLQKDWLMKKKIL
ncbi:MAG TPA: GNAT family N-acetyltransferase [Chitinophagaceae bacterium]|jgi:ribosomal protein S18 acetylase RimI-like enzyme|nr:GNAT family N-acetyltransferase [Chitinophagaceae bacterium]